MKYLLPFLLSFAALAVVPLPPRSLSLAWDYPASAQSTDLVFKLYHSSDLSVPQTNWLVLTNVAGTNLAVTLSVIPGAHFFYLTASNWWGESGPSNLVLTPPVAVSPSNTVIQLK